MSHGEPARGINEVSCCITEPEQGVYVFKQAELGPTSLTPAFYLILCCVCIANCG
jgi:hypothetical protein